MARSKRSREDEGACIPMGKRRVPLSDQVGKHSKSARSLNKKADEDGHRVIPKAIFIDLSNDEEEPISQKPTSKQAILKNLPPPSPTGEFPRFDQGAVYIIVDPEDIQYQYRLHLNVLSQVSPMFAESLKKTFPEAMENWKTAVPDAEALFELVFSEKHGKWIFRRAPFTIWEQAVPKTEKAITKDVSKVSDSVSKSFSESVLQVVDPLNSPEAASHTDNTIAPGTLASGIVVDQIAAISVAKGEVSSLQENANDIPGASKIATSPMEDDPELVSTEFKVEPAERDGNTSNESESDEHAGSIELAVQPDMSATTEKIRSPLLSVNSDLPAASSSAFEGNDILRSDTENIALISCPEVGDISHEMEVAQPVSLSTAQNESIPEAVDFNSASRLKAIEDKLVTIIPSSDIATPLATIIPPSDIATPLASTEIDESHFLGQQSTNAPLKSSTMTRPPTELCEAYNNLFLAFYSRYPQFCMESISTALEQCENLITVSSYLQTIPIIRPFAIRAVGFFGREIFPAIIREPFRWLRLAITLENTRIFKECIIHIVGTYKPGPQGQFNLPADLPVYVRELILFKVRQIDQQRMDINERLYNSSIVDTSSAAAAAQSAQPASSEWLAVQIWRDWFCRQMVAAHLDPHKTGRLYRTIHQAADDDYLTLPEVKAAIEKIVDPVKVEADVIMDDLDLLKAFARNTVAPLCRNNGSDNIDQAGVEYLTCTYVADVEVPWYESERRKLDEWWAQNKHLY